MRAAKREMWLTQVRKMFWFVTVLNHKELAVTRKSEHGMQRSWEGRECTLTRVWSCVCLMRGSWRDFPERDSLPSHFTFALLGLRLSYLGYRFELSGFHIISQDTYVRKKLGGYTCNTANLWRSETICESGSFLPCLCVCQGTSSGCYACRARASPTKPSS